MRGTITNRCLFSVSEGKKKRETERISGSGGGWVQGTWSFGVLRLSKGIAWWVGFVVPASKGLGLALPQDSLNSGGWVGLGVVRIIFVWFWEILSFSMDSLAGSVFLLQQLVVALGTGLVLLSSCLCW